MKTATRTLLAQYRRTVKAVEPSAYLHSWRILGCSGSVVYGIYNARNEWLSANERTGLAAWQAAAARVAEGSEG